ncbi:MAG TPA: RtcB family protein [Candidatus Nanoarchaeia archaeon]|nr:RtcB family protein [Candidatus Nanoarchaeia archaeon]
MSDGNKGNEERRYVHEDGMGIELERLGPNAWRIPRKDGMRVPAVIYASEKLIQKIKEDKTLIQAQNVTHLKGIQKSCYVMPDAHQGYGFPIGGVAAFDIDEGVISPGGVGYDINCSVRLLRTDLSFKDFNKKKTELIRVLFDNVPCGVGRGSRTKFSKDQITELLGGGAQWVVKQGFGKKEDCVKTEENGKMDADPNEVSQRAMQRGLDQVGTLGAGNHFLEIQKIGTVFENNAAKVFGIDDDEKITVMIHCGSRGLGHQVASDFIKLMEDEYGFKDLPDRELICAPVQSSLGQRYLKAMAAAANFGFANKQMITHHVRESFNKVFGETDISVMYDICHNIAKIEDHIIDGVKKKVCVHRKGATRSLGPGRKEVPEQYRDIGQPIIIPGSMGTASYVLAGTKTAEEVSFSSTAHGAGRVSSRSKALHNIRGEDVKRRLEAQGIEVKSASWKTIAEEAPEVYKDIDEVIRVSKELGIGIPIVRLLPIGVIKG